MKLFPIFLLLFFSFNLFAQEDVEDFYEPRDNDIRMGFTFGISYNMLSIEKSDWSQFPSITDSINSVSSKNAPGVNIGMLINQKVTDYFQIRVYPNLFFYSNSISYDTKYEYIEKVKLRNSVLNVPIQFNFRPVRKSEIQIFFGGKYSYIFGNSDYDSSLLLEIKKSNLYAEAGIGYEFDVNDKRMFTELKFSYGFNNLIPEENNSIYRKSISSIRFNTITFTISYF